MIKIRDAYEHNLKHISVNIPKKKITVFTGVSGSGKSSLCMDTIAAESRRELNDTFPSFVQQYLPKYGRPHVRKIENLPITMILDQKRPASNSRSTLATYTDIMAFLRLLYARVGHPFVGYSDHFSFNHPEGMCKRCGGIGQVTELDIHKLVDFDKCLKDEGVINFPAFTTGAWRWKRYANSGLFDLDKKIKDYSETELEMFLYSPQVKLKNPPSNWPKSAKFEGIYPRMYRSIIHTKEGKRHQKILSRMVNKFTCPDCQGARLNDKIRTCRINGKNIAELLMMPLPEALVFIKKIEAPLAKDIKQELIQRIEALMDIGLSYLSLSRSMNSMSGGEAQRIKIARYINSSLSDVAYVLDEPSVGLHYHDIRKLKKVIEKLRDHGNTILIVEHHPEIIKMADHIIDLGPESGMNGGEIVFEGSYHALLKSNTHTGQMLKDHLKMEAVTVSNQKFVLENLKKHNLKDLTLNLPLACMVSIIGVAGSGKTSLLEEVINRYEGKKVVVDQKSIGTNSRSTPATYLDIADRVRKIFSKVHGISTSYFSFNAKGACPVCKGKGIIVSEMAFMDHLESECSYCQGKRYNEEVLAYQVKGLNIYEALSMTVDEALEFYEDRHILKMLNNLKAVGLGYLSLDQMMTSLSGGELQRLKLANHMHEKQCLYILDEPSSGLHLYDVRKLINLFKQLVDQGNSVLIVDHHMDIIRSSDYLIELGPEGGDLGGQILYEGPPNLMIHSEKSISKLYL